MIRQWTPDNAREWYESIPWLVGCNFTPSTAINQLEMWQEESFDPDTIDRELGVAASIGMNTVRTYLHDLLWGDPDGFSRRLDLFFAIVARHGIRPVRVIFDDCWNPGARLDPQPVLPPMTDWNAT